jgi:hypothetical protein
MTIRELIDQYQRRLEVERRPPSEGALDSPIAVTNGRLLETVGTLHLYECEVQDAVNLPQDVAVTILPPDEMEPTEGVILGQNGRRVCLQVFDAVGETLPSATLVPDSTGFLAQVSARLGTIAEQANPNAVGCAERLIPWLQPSTDGSSAVPSALSNSSVLTTLWQEDSAIRWNSLATTAIELIRQNKRILLVGPDHRSLDLVLGHVARAMKAVGLNYKSWLSRYELCLERASQGIPLTELGFEAQMHHFYAKSRAEKATLRRKYERFRELTPLLAYKAQKQRDLDEVRLLEWRLLTQLSELQTKIKEIGATLEQYEQLPLWKRLSMQTVGKNVESLQEYRTIYESQIRQLLEELEIAKGRIAELVPEAAVPKDLRPEFDELKDEVKRLGGTKKIRELLAAEEGTNRQAFIQNRRLVATTAGRLVTDPLFARVRFDVLMVDQGPSIPGPLLLHAASLVTERIILSGDQREIETKGLWNPERDLLGQPGLVVS